jgi:hypothetical protein
MAFSASMKLEEAHAWLTGYPEKCDLEPMPPTNVSLSFGTVLASGKPQTRLKKRVFERYRHNRQGSPTRAQDVSFLASNSDLMKWRFEFPFSEDISGSGDE